MTVFLEDLLAQDYRHSDRDLLDRICFLIDVQRRLQDRYTDQRLIARAADGDVVVSARTLRAVTTWLLDRIEADRDIKAVNTFLKLADGHLRDAPSPASATEVEWVKSLVASIGLPQLADSGGLLNVVDASRRVRDGGTDQRTPSVNQAVAMRNWNSVVVAWNKSPVAAAYLSVLQNRGLEPARLIRAVPVIPLKRRVRRRIGSSARSLLRLFGSGDRTVSSRVRPEIFRRMPAELPESSAQAFRNRSARVEVKTGNINDERLVAEIADCRPERILFTGGGIVRPQTFERAGGNWLHMHPGRLPGVRGADGFFWSVLLHGYPSVSAIYQDPGIDTGEVLIEKHFERPEMDVDRIAKLGSHRHAIVYRTILGLFDPWMRALTLDALLDEEQMPGKPIRQSSTGAEGVEPRGRAYHFMHPLLRARAIDVLVEHSS
ncbi:hypothetical protein BA899_01915 [Spiribacter sp. SSL99]|nr:hypothetical protein BA899_01915 [Spiribacter sp. SSL99]